MATLVQIMDGLQARLDTIPGLNTSDVTPGQVVTPAAVVGLPEDINYLVTFSETNTDLRFIVRVMVSQTLDFEGQKTLAGFIDRTGDSSIRRAIEAEDTLGGLVDFCTVETCQPGPVTFNGVQYYGAIFTVLVNASGDGE